MHIFQLACGCELCAESIPVALDSVFAPSLVPTLVRTLGSAAVELTKAQSDQNPPSVPTW